MNTRIFGPFGPLILEPTVGFECFDYMHCKFLLQYLYFHTLFDIIHYIIIRHHHHHHHHHHHPPPPPPADAVHTYAQNGALYI